MTKRLLPSPAARLSHLILGAVPSSLEAWEMPRTLWTPLQPGPTLRVAARSMGALPRQ